MKKRRFGGEREIQKIELNIKEKLRSHAVRNYTVLLRSGKLRAIFPGPE